MHRSVKRPNLKQAFLFGLIAAGAVGCAEAPVVQAPVVYPDEAQGSAKFCVTPQEMDSLMIAGVKSRFMVAALACNGKTGFNAFINKNRPALLAAEKVTTGYFSKHYGRAAMSMQDEYITNLASITVSNGTMYYESSYPQTNAATLATTNYIAPGAILGVYASEILNMPVVVNGGTLQNQNATTPAAVWTGNIVVSNSSVFSAERPRGDRRSGGHYGGWL